MNEIKKIAISAGIGFIVGIIIMLAVFFSIRSNFTRTIDKLEVDIQAATKANRKIKNELESARGAIAELERINKRTVEDYTRLEEKYKRQGKILRDIEITNTDNRERIGYIANLANRGIKIIEDIENTIQD
jgi:peptidoglycan hydrolase CwlO-like protein